MKKTVIAFLILSVLNVVIFYFREAFAYVPVATHETLYENHTDKNLNKWIRFSEDYPAEEETEAKQISSNWFDEKDVTTLDSVLKIANKIHNNFNKQTDRPSLFLELQSPLNKYKTLLKDSTEKLWCGTYSQIFNFFCLSNNILSRYIEIINPGDHHVLNESYLPDRKKWVMIDVTFNINAPKNDKNQLLNLIEFASELRNNSLPFKYPYTHLDTVTKKHHEILNYYIPDRPYYYHFYIDNRVAYKFENKLARYLFPVSWYTIFTYAPVSNYMFGIKIALIYLWVASGLILLYITLYNDRNKRLE
jgi:hypothetical protein